MQMLCDKHLRVGGPLDLAVLNFHERGQSPYEGKDEAFAVTVRAGLPVVSGLVISVVESTVDLAKLTTCFVVGLWHRLVGMVDQLLEYAHHRERTLHALIYDLNDCALGLSRDSRLIHQIFVDLHA